MTPLRIQLSRKRGWRMPPGTRKVDRTTKFGNPFVAHPDRGPSGRRFRMAPEIAVGLFRSQLKKMGAWFPVPLPWPKGKIPAGEPTTVDDVRRELAGKHLACWCRLCPTHKDGKPLGIICSECEPCHADVLLELANQTTIPKAIEAERQR